MSLFAHCPYATFLPDVLIVLIRPRAIVGPRLYGVPPLFFRVAEFLDRMSHCVSITDGGREVVHQF